MTFIWQNFQKRKEVALLTLIPERPCCFSRTFSGFISQWIILFLYRVSRHCRRLCANFLTSCSENPWNLFFLINSYKFIDKSSNVIQVWLLKRETRHESLEETINDNTNCVNIAFSTSTSYIMCKVLNKWGIIINNCFNLFLWLI